MQQRRKPFRDLGAAGEAVFSLRSILKLDDWTKLKKQDFIN